MAEHVDISVANAVLIATEARHATEIALTEFRAHERLCIERGDRQMEALRRSEVADESIKTQQQLLHDRISAGNTLLAEKIDKNQRWTVSLVVGGLVLLCGFLVGFAYWLATNIPALQHP